MKRTGAIEAPLFACSRIDLSVQWKELFHGAVVGKIIVDAPRVSFVSGTSAEEKQTGAEGHWTKLLESLFPFTLNRLEIREGEIHFANEHSSPPVDIFIRGLSATATNLTNTRDLKQPLPSGVSASGTTVGGGGFEIELHLNALKENPTFEMTTQLTNVNLVALNDFLKVYGKFDVDRGTFALYSSFAAKDGGFDGYAKVFFENLDVFAWEKERKKNVLQVFWQAIVGTLTTVFKNQPNDRLATTIPISGSFAGTNVHTWTAVGTLLRNAFIRALIPQLDEKITTDDVETPSHRSTHSNRGFTPDHGK